MINAFASSQSPAHIHTDPDTIRKQTQEVIETGVVPMVWSHFSWWAFFADIFKRRTSIHAVPLIISWCPAHVMEDIPLASITTQMAMAHKTTIQDIRLNRIADQVAKATLQASLGTFHKSWLQVQNVIFEQQKRLCNIAIEVTKLRKCHADVEPVSDEEPEVQDSNTSIHPFDLTMNHSVADFSINLPRWEWFPNEVEFNWTPQFGDLQMPQRIAFTQDDWQTCLAFFRQLKWKIAPDLKTAYIEIAYEFWHAGHRFLGINQTISAYTTLLRKFISQAAKISQDQPAAPGTMQPGCKSNGKTLPAGYLAGCYPYISSQALKALALPLFRGRTHQLRLWEEEFN